jgi:hypothetical protein
MGNAEQMGKGGIAMYRCPFCNFRAVTLCSLKKHMDKYHLTDECPICRRRSRNITGHFYIYMTTHKDPQHTLLFYLYSRRRLDEKKKEEVKRLLETVKLEVRWI